MLYSYTVIHANHLDVHLDGSHSTPWTLDISKTVGNCPGLMHALVVKPGINMVNVVNGPVSWEFGRVCPTNKRKSHLTRKTMSKVDLSYTWLAHPSSKFYHILSWLILAAKLLKLSRRWEWNPGVNETSINYSKPPAVELEGQNYRKPFRFPLFPLQKWSFPVLAIDAVSAPCKAKEVKEISALASRCRRPCERWEAWRRGWLFFVIWKKCGRVKSHEFTCEIMWIGGLNHPSIACDFDRYSMIIYWQSGLDSSHM